MERKVGGCANDLGHISGLRTFRAFELGPEAGRKVAGWRMEVCGTSNCSVMEDDAGDAATLPYAAPLGAQPRKGVRCLSSGSHATTWES